MGLAADIGTWLAAGGYVGGVTGWTFAAEHLPSTPDQVVVAYQFSGSRPDTRPGLDRPGLQLVARAGANDYAAAEAKLETIREAMDAVGVWPQTISGTSYRFIRAIHSPFLREYDATRRPVLVCNFDCGVSR